MEERTIGRKEVEMTVRRLGAKRTYRGYEYVIDAILIYIDLWKKDVHVLITKDVYPQIAKKYNTTKMSVERDIRTVVQCCWNCNKKAIEEMFGYEINRKPENKEFLDIVAYNLLEK